MNTLYNRAEFTAPPRARPSVQLRFGHPHPELVEGELVEGVEGKPHPRAKAMASVMQDIAASGGGVVFRDLAQAGFTAAEIIEHHVEAARLAAEASTREVAPEGDRVPDIIARARAPLPNRPPVVRLPLLRQAQDEEGGNPHGEPRACRGVEPDDPHLRNAWGRYCAARAAYLLDPWVSQRERCMALLERCLDMLPLLPRQKNDVLVAVDATMRTLPGNSR